MFDHHAKKQKSKGEKWRTVGMTDAGMNQGVKCASECCQ